MSFKKEVKHKFWEYQDNGKVKILNAKLLGFIESEGFATAMISETDHILVRMINNRMSKADEAHVDRIIKELLIDNEEWQVFETYARGMGSYISKRKFNLLDPIELVNDRDKYDSSNFFFLNCYCTISSESISVKGYEHLEKPIWENRIIRKEYEHPQDFETGQFEQFCKNIAGKSELRFQALKTIIGYLLHRNKEVGEPKAIILYDERMGQNNQAHGGTGKTLLSQAISKCREVEIFDGKEIKSGNWFKNQRIEITTDVLVYDDLNREISLENFYTIITSGIEVEKKRKQAFYIDAENSPKIMISSNYPVKGPGGPSDERRRHEFELSNYYSDRSTPEMEFGNRFFGNNWSQKEWNLFYQFMMSCVQEYLKNGLLEVAPINLGDAKLKHKTNEKFVEFADAFVEFGNWQNKRDFESAFHEFYPEHADISSHMIKKWLDAYATDKGTTVGIKSSAGDYFFKIRKEVQDA